jgi:hypothetical protein
MIEDRLTQTGVRKGRVLSVWQGDQVVAACCWHVPDRGPIVIFDLGCRNAIDKTTAEVICGALLACLRDIGEAIGRDPDSLRWGDHALDRAPKGSRASFRKSLRQRATVLGFSPLRPRPKWWQGRWAVERRF